MHRCVKDADGVIVSRGVDRFFRNFELLGSPIGDAEFCSSFVKTFTKKAVAHTLGPLSSLDDPQVVHMLLRLCASFCRVVHLLRGTFWFSSAPVESDDVLIESSDRGSRMTLLGDVDPDSICVTPGWRAAESNGPEWRLPTFSRAIPRVRPALAAPGLWEIDEVTVLRRRVQVSPVHVSARVLPWAASPWRWPRSEHSTIGASRREGDPARFPPSSHQAHAGEGRAEVEGQFAGRQRVLCLPRELISHPVGVHADCAVLERTWPLKRQWLSSSRIFVPRWRLPMLSVRATVRTWRLPMASPLSASMTARSSSQRWRLRLT